MQGCNHHTVSTDKIHANNKTSTTHCNDEQRSLPSSSQNNPTFESYIFIFWVSKFFLIYKRIKKELGLKRVIHIYLPEKRVRSTSCLNDKDKGMVWPAYTQHNCIRLQLFTVQQPPHYPKAVFEQVHQNYHCVSCYWTVGLDSKVYSPLTLHSFRQPQKSQCVKITYDEYNSETKGQK
jgi:hypothetical protein